MMKVTTCLLICFCVLFCFLSTSHAYSINLNPTPEELSNMENIAKRVFTKSTTVSPHDSITAIEYLYVVGKGLIKIAPEIATKLKIEEGVKLAGGELGKVAIERAVDAGIDVIAENVEKKSGIDKYQTELLLKSVKNVIVGGGNPFKTIYGDVKDSAFIIKASWEETAQAVTKLSPNAPMDDSLRTYYELMTYLDKMKKEKHYGDYVQGVIGLGGFALADGINIIGGKIGGMLYDSGLYNKKDTSKISSQNVVSQVNNVPPKIVSVGISVNRTADTLSYIFNFNKPMAQYVPGYLDTSGFCGPAGCTGTFSNFVWSNNGKTAKTTFTPSGGSYVSPSGNTVLWSTDNNTFVDTRNKFAPAKSGSIELTQ